MYRFSVFGEPGTELWGWRIGGHHLSLNFTIVRGKVDFRPAFMGADPAESTLAGGYLFRPFAGIEDLARDLVESLDNQQRDMVVLSDVAPYDLMTGNAPHLTDDITLPHLWQPFRETPPEIHFLKARESEIIKEAGLTRQHLDRLQWARAPKGLEYARMTTMQRRKLGVLLEQYIDRLPIALATREAKKIESSKEGLCFAWAGSLERHRPHYYRIQGPRLLIEYDNFQRSGNHVHSVWRNPEGDFGEDLLTNHIRNDH